MKQLIIQAQEQANPALNEKQLADMIISFLPKNELELILNQYREAWYYKKIWHRIQTFPRGFSKIIKNLEWISSATIQFQKGNSCVDDDSLPLISIMEKQTYNIRSYKEIVPFSREEFCAWSLFLRKFQRELIRLKDEKPLKVPWLGICKRIDTIMKEMTKKMKNL